MDDSELNELKKKIQELLAESQAKLAEITAASENAKQKEAELNTFHSRIIEIKAAVESNATSLTDTYKKAVAVKEEIDGLLKTATDVKNKIDVLHTESNTKTSEISKFYKLFEELKKKVEDSDDGIASTLTKVGDIFGKITKTDSDASTSKDEILKHKVKSEGFLEESTQLKGDISINYTESERLKGEIGKILDLVRDTGLANSFDGRRKRSQNSSIIAFLVIISGIIASAILIHNVFLTTEGQNLFTTINSDYVKFLLRVTLTSPGVFLAWFGAEQYAKERFFLEQYEFKTAAALALENYTKLLKDNYAEKKDEIFKLNLELIRSVYKEPIFIKPKTGWFAKFKMPTTDTEVEAKVEDK